MEPQQPASQNYSPRDGPGKTILIIALILSLIASLIFSGWAYKKTGDYKNISDAKVAVAAQSAVSAKAQQLQDNFDKQNVKTYYGSPTYGSVTFNYPKTWSAYVDTSSSSEPINGYFHPDVVPAVQGNFAFALRVELVDTDYSQVQQQFTSSISQGMITSRAYIPPKMKGAPNVTPGTYMTGQINQSDQTQNGAMAIVRVRDKTLEIYTQSTQYLNDFKNIILASLKFSP